MNESRMQTALVDQCFFINWNLIMMYLCFRVFMQSVPQNTNSSEDDDTAEEDDDQEISDSMTKYQDVS